MENELPSNVVAKEFDSSSRLVARLEKRVATVPTTISSDSTRRAANALHMHRLRRDVMNKEAAHKAAAPTIESTIKYFANGALTKLDATDTVNFAALMEKNQSYKGLTCPMVVATLNIANAFTKAFDGCPICKTLKTCSKKNQWHFKSEYANMQLLKEFIDKYTFGVK